MCHILYLSAFVCSSLSFCVCVCVSDMLTSAQVLQSSVPPVIRSGGSLKLNFVAYQAPRVVFEGPIMVTVQDFNSSILLSTIVQSSGGSSVQLQVVRDSAGQAMKNIVITLTNNLSRTEVHQRLTLAGEGIAWPTVRHHKHGLQSGTTNTAYSQAPQARPTVRHH